jgi:murein DD-endopeptidase MepM/ murein hydrolase activator NlpD/SLT domain-containing protein
VSTPGGVEGPDLRIPIVADASGFASDLEAKIRAAAEGAKAKVQIDADTRLAQSKIDALKRNASRITVLVDANVDAARAKIDALARSRGLGVTVDADTSAAERKIDALLARYGASRITIRVDADTSAADSALRRVQQQQNRVSGTRTAVNLTSTGAETLVKTLGDIGTQLVSIGKVAGIATGVLELAGAVTQLAGSAGALTAALGPAVNLIGLLPALGTTAAQGILAVVAGFSGIGAAVKQTQQAQSQAAQTTATNAKSQEAAAQRVTTALNGIADAQRAVARDAEQSARQVADAQERLTKAVEDGQRRVAEARQKVTDAGGSASGVTKLPGRQNGDAASVVTESRAVIDARTRLARAEQDAAARIAQARQDIADAQAKGAQEVQRARADEVAAEGRLAAAQQNATRAQENLDKARQQAKRNLDEMNLALKGSALDEEDAALAVIRAKQQLDRVNRSAAAKGIDKQEADLAYRQALQRQAEIQQKNKELTQDAAAANRAGVEGAQNVLDAKQQVTQSAQDVLGAQNAVTAAQKNIVATQVQAHQETANAQADYAKVQQENARNLADANLALARAQQDQARDIADAQQSLAEAERQSTQTVADARRDLARARADQASGAADAARNLAQAEAALAAAHRNSADTVDKENAAQRNLANTMKGLSPVAQRFVQFLVDKFLPAIRDIRKQAQEGLLPGVQRALETLLPYSDAIGKSLHDTAQIIGDFAAAAAKLVTSGPFRRDFGNIAVTNDQIIRSFAGTFLNLLDVFRNLVHEGIPFVQRFALAVERATGRLRATTQRKRDDGSLFAMFEDAYNTAGRLGHILKTLGDALFNLFHAGRPAGNSLLQSLSDMIDKFDAWTKSPQGQQSITDFFNTAADGIRAFAGPLADIGKILGKANAMQGLADVLGFIAGALERISNVQGFGPIVDALFKMAGLAIGLGLLLKVFKPLFDVLSGIKKLGRVVIPGLPGSGKGGTGSGTGPSPADKVQRVTWGPTALPVRIVGGGGPGGGGGPDLSPPEPGTTDAEGRTWGDPNHPGTDPYGPAAPTRGQRLRMRVASTRVGGALDRTAVRLGSVAGGRVGTIGTAVGRGAGRLAGTGLIGIAGMVGGDLLGNAIIGNSQHGSGRNIAGNALKSGVQGAALGATVGSIIPGVGTAIGAAVGGAVGAIYGAIKAGLTFKKVQDMLEATGRGIKSAWDKVVGPVVDKVVGWWHDIVHWTEWLADVLVGHSIIPDMIRKIMDVFGWLAAPIATFIGWFRNDLPNAAKAMLAWVTGNWSKVTGLFRKPIEAFLGWVTGRDTGMGSLRGALVAIVTFVTSPQRFAWHLIQGVFDKPVKAFLSWLTGRNTGLGWLKQSFTAVLTWVTSPGTWNWGRILGTIEKPIKDAIDFLTGRGSGWAKIKQSFSGMLSWVTSPGTWNWASRVLSVVTSPITSAYNWLTGKSSGFARIRAAFTSVKDWATGTFKRGWDDLKGIITGPVDAARAALVGTKGLLGRITGAFGSFVSGAGDKLSGLRSVWASPIHFVLDTVINKGLIGAFNRLAKLLPGLSEIGTINIPAALQPRSKANPKGYATGTANMVLPGYTPGRDVHRFYSPTGGAIDLSGGESILRPEVTRALGERWVNGVNRAAMSRGVRGAAQYLGGYWGGGVLHKITGAAGSAWNGIKSVGSTVKRGVLGATDAVGDAAGATWNAASGAASALGGILTDPVGWVKDKIKGALGGLNRLGNTSIVQAAKALPKAAADGILSTVKDAVSSMFGGSGEPVVWPVGHVPLGPGFGAGGARWGHTGGRHTGQDFEVPTGTPVHPALAGIVQIIRSMPPGQSYGNYVELSHGANLHTLYAHLSRFLVKVGDRITPSDVLGLSGATGNASGPHLHFEVREGGGTGSPVDPMPYLQGKKGPTAASGGGRGSTPMQWAGQVAQVLAMLGQPQTMAGAVLRRIGFESTGNPTVVNRTDSNWRAGHPSVGLMQVIADTFRAYAGPFVKTGPYEYGVSTNPLANIYAGTNYAIHRYGSLSNIDPLNRPKGYDLGGVLHPGQRGINLTNDPEIVFNAEQSRTLHRLVSQAPRVQDRAATTLTKEDIVAALRAAPTQIDVHPSPGMDEIVLAKRVGYELEWIR